MKLEAQLQRRWYGSPRLLWLLWPLEWLYRCVVTLRRCAYARGWLRVWRAPVPVVVVGNISVGGTGKTPVVIELCAALRAAGFKPGVVSRGYGARPPQFPFLVQPGSDVVHSGDEPLLLARRSGCPVVIAPRRAAAAQYLLQQSQCDVIVCDDGLQHYALARDIEWVVVDGARGFGNRHCLPVGPLREPTRRLAEVDAVLINTDLAFDRRPERRQFWFHLEPTALVQLATARSVPVAEWGAQRRVHAVAGIGNPGRFFATLRELGFELIEHAFGDHHVFSARYLQFGDELPVVMTEKDAVKCAAFANEQLWYLAVQARLPDSLLSAITGKLSAPRH